MKNYDYLQILEIDNDGYYDFTEAGQRLLDQLKNNDNLTKEEKIEIIINFGKYQPGEEYGGGDSCNNTDCYRCFTYDYFIEIKGKDYKPIRIGKKWKQVLTNVSYYFCPDCIDGIEIDELFPKIDNEIIIQNDINNT